MYQSACCTGEPWSPCALSLDLPLRSRAVVLICALTADSILLGSPCNQVSFPYYNTTPVILYCNTAFISMILCVSSSPLSHLSTSRQQTPRPPLERWILPSLEIASCPSLSCDSNPCCTRMQSVPSTMMCPAHPSLGLLPSSLWTSQTPPVSVFFLTPCGECDLVIVVVSPLSIWYSVQCTVW